MISEKRIPKHGDENGGEPFINGDYNSREKRIPKHGDENTVNIVAPSRVPTL